MTWFRTYKQTGKQQAPQAPPEAHEGSGLIGRTADAVDRRHPPRQASRSRAVGRLLAEQAGYSDQGEQTVNTQLNPEEVVRKFFDCYTNGRPGDFDQVVAPDYTDYGHSPPGRGPDGARDDYKNAVKQAGAAGAGRCTCPWFIAGRSALLWLMRFWAISVGYPLDSGAATAENRRPAWPTAVRPSSPRRPVRLLHRRRPPCRRPGYARPVGSAVQRRVARLGRFGRRSRVRPAAAGYS